jgi:hypothetical protein
LSEELDRRTLELAVASVAEVETALASQQAALVDATQMARAALTAGNRGEWLLADAQHKAAGWNCVRLRGLLEARAAEVPPAMEKFLESRLEHEQVKQLVESAQQTRDAEEDRKTQAAADDWFLSKHVRSADEVERRERRA